MIEAWLACTITEEMGVSFEKTGFSWIVGCIRERLLVREPPEQTMGQIRTPEANRGSISTMTALPRAWGVERVGVPDKQSRCSLIRPDSLVSLLHTEVRTQKLENEPLRARERLL